MKTALQNRITMLTTVSGVLNKHKPTWEEHEAYSEIVDEITGNSTTLDEQIQIAEGNSGASNAKQFAREALALAASEVIGAVYSFAVKTSNPALQAKVDFAPSQVTAGKAADVVTRCKAIHTAASDVGDGIVKYGITPEKLTAFKAKIDAFDGMKTAPRQSRVEKSAAARLLTELVRTNAELLDSQLDRLMPQFKESAPTFYNEYFAARVVVDARGSRSSASEDSTEPTPAHAKAAAAA